MGDTFVIKRNGNGEKVSFDKIQRRLEILAGVIGDQFKEYPLNVNLFEITKHVTSGLYPNIPTSKLDEFAAEHCASLVTKHPDYNTLAARIIISNHQKNTSSSFSETVSKLYNYRDHNDKHSPIVSESFFKLVN